MISVVALIAHTLGFESETVLHFTRLTGVSIKVVPFFALLADLTLSIFLV